MKNNQSHRSLKTLLGFITFLVFSVNMHAQTETGTVLTKIFHNSSSTANSITTYYIELTSGWKTGISSVTSLTLKNVATGTIVYTHSGSTINYGTVTSSLAPGQYLFSGTVSTTNAANKVVSVSLSQNIWVGNKVYWENCFDMEQGISQYSTKRSVATVGQTYSYVQSFNSLAANTLGWIELSKLNSNINDSHVYWILEAMANPRSFTPTDNISYVEFYRDNTGASGIKVRYKQTNGVYQDQILTGVNATDRVRFQRNANNTAILQINNSTTTTFSFPSTITGALKVTILAKQLNDQADEIASSFTYPSANFPFSTTFNTPNNTNTGTLTAFITPLSGFTSPYNYFVTPSPVADMKAVYKYLKDSIYPGGVDSTTFFRGATSASSFTSTQIPSGSYYASVFDSKGVRIYTNTYDVSPVLTLSNKNRFENLYNEFVSTSDNSYFTTNTYITEESKSTLVYYLTNTTVEQSFGVLNQTDDMHHGTNSYSNLKYGFTVNAGQLYMVVNGVTSNPISAKLNVPIELVFENGSVSFRSEGAQIISEVLPDNFDYMSGMYLKKWGLKVTFKPISVSFRPYAVRAKVTDNACGKNSGDVQLTFLGLHGAALTNVNFTLKNITDDANPITVYSNISGAVTYNDLPLGVYSLEGSMTVGGTPYTGINQVIYVGSKLSWDPYVNIVTWPQNGVATHYAVSSSTVSNSNPAKAISTNKLDPSTNGWMVFTVPSVFPILHGKSILVSLSEAPLLASLEIPDHFMPHIRFYGGYAIAVTTPTVGTPLVSIIQNYVSNTPLLMVRNGGTVNYRQNYDVRRSVTGYTNGRWKPAFFTNYANTGINEAYASFQCKPYNTELFAQLKYDMDGYYHIMKNGDIKFVFNQEYNDANLTFNLYNSNDILIKTQADFPALATTNGMNYLTLTVRNAYCIGKGFFYLEVINSKNEKMYLRFYNDYYDPTCPLEGQNGEGDGEDG